MNLMMLLEMATSGFGDRVAVKSGSATFSYAQLFAAAGAAAQELTSSGCERMALLDVSSLAVPVGLFASAWAGVPFVPLNYRLTRTELERLVGEIAPSYLVTDGERAEELSKLAGTTVVAREPFLERAASGSAPEPDWPMDPDQIAILLFTSSATSIWSRTSSAPSSSPRPPRKMRRW
jgi:long-chain acyl-CoA synthetase